MTKSGSCTVGFCGQYVTINSYGPGSTELVNFLCCDLHTYTDSPVNAVYDLMIVGKKQMLSLWQEEEQLYFGDCRYELACTLINEIIYQCIVDNRAGHAIHAGAVGSETGGILLPGKSGSGKSTFTTWLVFCGCNYLTDELVILAGNDHRIHPFTRPLSLKIGSSSVLSSFLSYGPQEVVNGANGFMLPHRLINENFPAAPPLSLILFPEYKAGTTTELTKMTTALGCARLMECYVNARNIQDHGISQLAEITRNTPIYQLTYGSFDGLHELLDESFPTFFRQKSR